MKVVGIVTEYNPFHNGHLYHLKKSKEVTGADFCIALMSGSFVQRGAPAIFDKYTRAAMALNAGADLVIEMPVSFSTSSAREFSSYSISLFTALHAVDTVVFGSECGNIEQLSRLASYLSSEPSEYSNILKDCMKTGMTFPEARQKALSHLLPEETGALLDTPNNILGIEYIKAGLELHSPLSFKTIRREGSRYHDTSIDGSLASASAIREAIQSGAGIDELTGSLPPCCSDLIRGEIPVFLNDFSSVLNYRIWESRKGSAETAADMTPELAARIQKNILEFDTYENRIKNLKSRQFTYTRVNRALLHLLLDIEEKQIDGFKEIGYAPYARILGFRKTASPLLSCLKEQTSIPLITKLADADHLLSPVALEMLTQEIDASHLYQAVKQGKGGVFKNEYTQPLVILP